MASIISEAAAVAELDVPGRLTASERAYCHGRRRRAEHVAARVLAKRLLLGELGCPVGDEAPWTQVGFRLDDRGAPHVELSGTVQEAANERGSTDISVSWSHTAKLVTVVLSM